MTISSVNNENLPQGGQQQFSSTSSQVSFIYAPQLVSFPRILMIGPHRTRTLGGISTLINGMLRSELTTEFDLRHIVSQHDEYKGLGKFVLACAALVQMLWAICWWRPDLILIHVGSNASLYRKAIYIRVARWLRQCVVAHFHAGDFDHYYARQGAAGQQFIRRALARSHKLIAVSPAAAQRLQELLPAADIVYVPNGIRTADFAPSDRAGEGIVRLLFVGAMGKLKGENDLLAALRLVIERLPHLRVSMLGHGAESVKAGYQDSAVWSRIEHLGPVPSGELARFYRAADIFVLPSYGEGLPMSVLEAMAAGLPVITTTVGGIPELVSDGDEGYLLRPGDVSGLADCIVKLATDAELRAVMGTRAKQKARQYDEAVMLQRLAGELRATLTNSGSLSGRRG